MTLIARETATIQEYTELLLFLISKITKKRKEIIVYIINISVIMNVKDLIIINVCISKNNVMSTITTVSLLNSTAFIVSTYLIELFRILSSVHQLILNKSIKMSNLTPSGKSSVANFFSEYISTSI